MQRFRIVLFVIVAATLLGCFGVAAQGAKETQFKTQGAVRASLDRLIEAYEGRQLSRFMASVAEDYVGERLVLESAVQSDFSSLHNMSIRYTVNHITFDGNGNASIGMNFVRSHMGKKSGKVSKTNGTAELVFKIEAGVYKLYSMKPVLFGITNN